MKLRGEWLVLAERVIDDALSGNVTLVSCIQQISAADFPAQHHGFGVAARFCCVGEPPDKPTPVHFRLVRHSDADGEEVVTDWNVTWAAGTRRSQVATNFRILRLRRPEIVEFRVDHRIGRGGWHPGPTCSIDVLHAQLTPAQRQELQAQLAALGLPPDALQR